MSVPCISVGVNLRENYDGSLLRFGNRGGSGGAAALPDGRGGNGGGEVSLVEKVLEGAGGA